MKRSFLTNREEHKYMQPKNLVPLVHHEPRAHHCNHICKFQIAEVIYTAHQEKKLLALTTRGTNIN